MKKFSTLIFLLLSFHLTIAQDSTKSTQSDLKHGLQFQIDRLLELSNFSGYTLSYRHILNNTGGIRIGLLTNINESDYDVTEQADTIKSSGPEFEHNYQLKLSVQYLQSLTAYKNFALIFGGGPFISYSKREADSKNLGSDYISRSSSKNEAIGYGLDLILGVEYKLAENVIISGEYGLTVLKENGDMESIYESTYTVVNQKRISKQSGEIDTFIIRGLGVNLGISVFF